MNLLETTISAGSASMLILEMLKYLIRFVFRKPDFSFPPGVYMVGIPVLNIAAIPLLALAGYDGYEIPVDWRAWARNIIRVAIAALISLGGYTVTIKPLKEYNKAQKVLKAPEKHDGYPRAL